MNYLEFLKTKVEVAPISGFEPAAEEIHAVLKPHQRDAVLWALRGGRRALFESFGLGKTVQELEYCRQVLRHEKKGSALIVMPLGVRQEFTHDAVELLGMEAPRYITGMAGIDGDGIYITNYERVRDGDIDPAGFTCCVLDEAAVLRSFGSKTYQTFLPKFKGVRYKLVATATPAPNRLKELIHYAGFLEVMDTGQALTRFFQRDSSKANNLTLYPHKEEEFWLWVSSWALMISEPADLGYDNEGYALPPMEIRPHMISRGYGAAADRDGQYKMLNDAATSLMEASHEKKDSIPARCALAKEIVDSDPEAHSLLWHDLEAERHELKRLMPEAVDIYGSMDYNEREKRVIDFSYGMSRLFATKKSLSGCGCNFQRFCHRAIFIGIDYEFHDFIQAVHRIYRFLQAEKVIIDIIYTEAEQPIYQALMDKWKLHNEQQEHMRQIVKKYGLTGTDQIKRMERSIGVEHMEVSGNRYTAIHGDCVEETAKMEENSADMILTSIPFSNHYEYTPSYNDFGHNENTQRFFEQMDYLSPELLLYIIYSRLDSDRYPFFDNKREYFEEYVAQKKNSKNLAYAVKTRLVQENAELIKQVEALGHFREEYDKHRAIMKVLEKYNIWSFRGDTLAEALDTRLSRTVPEDISSDGEYDKYLSGKYQGNTGIQPSRMWMDFNKERRVKDEIL